MVCKYFAEELGNMITIGVGESKLGEIWFNREGQSDSPLSKTEAENIALKIVAHLNEKYPITEERAEEWGDSDKTIEKIKVMNKASHGEVESPLDLLKLMCELKE